MGGVVEAEKGGAGPVNQYLGNGGVAHCVGVLLGRGAEEAFERGTDGAAVGHDDEVARVRGGEDIVEGCG